MSKFIKVFFVLSLFYMTNTVVACPPGASSNTYTFTVAGCEYSFEICYNCPVTATPTWFSFGDYKKLNPSCNNGINMNVVLDSVRNQLLQNRVWLYALCANSFPPCELGVGHWEEREFDCWYMHKYEDGTLEYRVCDYSSYCVQDYTVCFDQNYGPTFTKVGDWYHVGDSYCDVNSIMPSIPIPGTSSSCWFNTVCGQ